MLTQWFRVVLAAIAFAGFGLGAPFVGLSLIFFWSLGGTKLERRRRCQRVVGGSFRFFHAYMRFVGLIVYRPLLRLPQRKAPRVIVANHPTLVDVTAMLAAYPEACCFVKSSIYNNPLFYLIMKFSGHIKVRRDGAAGGPDPISEATRRLEEGSDVLLFPEGTRSPTMEVGEFRAGAFALAVHSEVSLALVAIFCSRPVLKRGTPWYLIPTQPVTLKLESLGEVAPLRHEPIAALTERVHGIFQSSLRAPATAA
jgi:1-acyl-sn-glycerol-3-phosphate acyltransferase